MTREPLLMCRPARAAATPPPAQEHSASLKVKLEKMVDALEQGDAEDAFWAQAQSAALLVGHAPAAPPPPGAAGDCVASASPDREAPAVGPCVSPPAPHEATMPPGLLGGGSEALQPGDDEAPASPAATTEEAAHEQAGAADKPADKQPGTTDCRPPVAAGPEAVERNKAVNRQLATLRHWRKGRASAPCARAAPLIRRTECVLTLQRAPPPAAAALRGAGQALPPGAEEGINLLKAALEGGAAMEDAAVHAQMRRALGDDLYAAARAVRTLQRAQGSACAPAAGWAPGG